MTIARHEPTGGLVLPGETPDEAIARLERRGVAYARLIESDEGQRLLEAARHDRHRRTTEDELWRGYGLATEGT